MYNSATFSLYKMTLCVTVSIFTERPIGMNNIDLDIILAYVYMGENYDIENHFIYCFSWKKSHIAQSVSSHLSHL